jgi:hypothetical protein
LEPRQLLSGLTLTAAGLADGFGLSTFATGFPENSFGAGPISVAFPATGGVLATDIFGNLRLFPTDTDGQDAASITPIQNFGYDNAFGLAQLSGTIYMTQAGDVVKLINNGASTQVVVSGVPGASAVCADPFNNLLYVDRSGNGAPIYVVDPVAKRMNVFRNVQADGLSLSPDGNTLYAAIDGGASAGHILGFDTRTMALDFDSGAISGGPDGIAVGKGPVAGNLFVNTNGGTIVEVNLATAAKTLIASGGSRGDLVTVDANNATLLLTQSDRIMRLVPGVFAIPQLATTTTLDVEPKNPNFSQSVILTAVVETTGTSIPTGSVTFEIDGQAQAPVSLTEVGALDQATFTTSTLLPGTHTITATYNGDPTFASSDSEPVSVTINALRPTFSGLIDQSITYGSTVTFTGTLAAGTEVPVGEEVAVTVDGVTNDATIASDGSFSTSFTHTDVGINARSTPYPVTYVYAGDAVFLSADGSSLLTVNPDALTIMAVSNTRAFDGTTGAASVPTIASGSLATGDTAEFTETYSTKNVGMGLTLTPTGMVDDGNGGNNYTYTFVAVSTGVITPAPLTITATSETKVYDGTTASSKTPTYGTLYGSDTVTDPTQAFASKDVLRANGSTLNVTGYTVIDGNGGKDYTVTTKPASGTITAALLIITATSDTKVYDGTTASSKTPTYGTLYGSDTVTGLAQAFASKDVLGANGSTLNVTGYTVNDGNGGKDYTVTTKPASGTITPALATVKRVEVENVRAGKKTTEVIVVQFTEALKTSAAQNIKNYGLVTIPSSTKQKGKPVSLASASYNAKAFTVTLRTSKPLVLSPPLALTITAAGLLDSLGRPLASNYTATLRKVGTPVTPTATVVRTAALSAAIDAALAEGARWVG